MNSGSEGFVTVGLILTVQKPEQGDVAEGAASLAHGHAESLIEQAINELSAKDAGDASYLYTRVLAKAIQEHLVLDDLHLSDVLIALRNAGYTIDRKTGMLLRAKGARGEVA